MEELPFKDKIMKYTLLTVHLWRGKIILLSMLFLIMSVRNVLPCESTSDYDTSLVEIIESGDLEGVKTAIASGIGVDDIEILLQVLLFG